MTNVVAVYNNSMILSKVFVAFGNVLKNAYVFNYKV
jgi:hypothetical protein